MGDELRGENLVHLNVRFSTETELKKIQDFLYEKSGQGVSFTGLVEAMANEVTIVTAVHNIKANKGSRTAGVDKMKMDKYSKKFLEAHREEIALHKAAKAAFDEAGLQKLPKVKALDAEFAELLTKKKAAYPEYRKARKEMQELVRAQKNVERFFAEEKPAQENEQAR